MWKNYFQGMSAECTFNTPTTKDEIDKVESLLNATLPRN